MVSTLKRYWEASSETFRCIHVARSIIKSRRFGKGQRIDFALLRFVSFRFGLLRFFCWWAIRDQGIHCDPPVLALPGERKDAALHELLTTARRNISVLFCRGEINGFVQDPICFLK
jgi:hypothetical protein